MSFQHITNPKTNRRVSIHSKLGREIIQNYSKYLRPGESSPPTIPTSPPSYIHGHLINGDLGGPSTPDNLVPQTAQSNDKHRVRVEEPLMRGGRPGNYLKDVYNLDSLRGDIKTGSLFNIIMEDDKDFLADLLKGVAKDRNILGSNILRNPLPIFEKNLDPKKYKNKSGIVVNILIAERANSSSDYSDIDKPLSVDMMNNIRESYLDGINDIVLDGNEYIISFFVLDK